MKILLANYRYFVSGGPERYMFNVSDQLQNKGHEIIPFSINYTKNHSTTYSKYFIEPISSRDEIYFYQQKKTVNSICRMFSRLFYSNEVEEAVTKLITDTSPDIAYVLHYLRKLSPSLLVGLKNKNVPIVVRLSDYAMLCPQAHFLIKNDPCTLCLDKDRLFDSIVNRCVKDSLAASLLNAFATWYHHKKQYFDLIDLFITTNMFMYEMMLRAGYPEQRLLCIPTFTDINTFSPSESYVKSDYIIYAGRLDSLKGVHVLIDAFLKLRKNKIGREIRLVVAGTGQDSYIRQLKNVIASEQLGSYIIFVGQVDTIELSNLLKKALFSIIPSLWYENLPNALLESFACGTPVIASDIGMLSESIKKNKTGFLFTVGNSDSLAEKMKYCLDNGSLLHEMALNARNEALLEYSSDNHIALLTNTFNKILTTHH